MKYDINLYPFDFKGKKIVTFQVAPVIETSKGNFERIDESDTIFLPAKIFENVPYAYFLR